MISYRINETTRIFLIKTKVFKYNEIATTVTNANRGTSRTKLYKELGAGSINFLRTFYKKTEGAPKYLYKLTPIKNNAYDARSTHSVGTYCCRTNARSNTRVIFIPFENGIN